MDPHDPNQPTTDSEFVARLAEALEQRERGMTPDVTQICAGREDLIPAMSSALKDASNLGELSQAAAASDPRLGQRIRDRYLLLERIGSGGMGIVYQAQDEELGRDVALKMLRHDVIRGPEIEERLAREGEVLASIQHPAVVDVYDRGRSGEELSFLVMPLLRGQTCGELLEDAPSRDPNAASVFGCEWVRDLLGADARLEGSYLRQCAVWTAELARGLDVAHSAGVVHRDVKPSNVFLREDGNAVLLDFGLVSFGSENTVASGSSALGTPAYMAPEQLETDREPTPRVDVYGLCATLYHLATFSRPFAGDPAQVLAALPRVEPVPAARLRKGFPRDLGAILEKGMAKDPKRRYASAAALASDLEAFLDYRPVVARPVSRVQRWTRIAWRYGAVKAVVAMTAALALVAVFLLVRRAQDDARKDRVAYLFEHLPKQAYLLPPPHLAVEKQDVEMTTLLAELVDKVEEPLPARLLYAGLLWRQKDFAAAGEQMQLVADYYKTPVCNAVAAAYQGEDGGAKIDPDALPEPAGDADKFVLAFHCIANPNFLRYQRATELLQESALRHVEEIGLLIHALVLKGKAEAGLVEAVEAFGEYNKLRETAIALDAERGYRTALTCQVAGVALLGLGRYRDAEVEFDEGLVRTPLAFSLWQNLGRSRQYQRDPGPSVDALNRAVELQPNSVKSLTAMVLAYLRCGNVEDARSVLEKVPFPDGRRGDRDRARMEAHVHLREAMDLVRSNGRDGQVLDLAQRAERVLAAIARPGSRPEYELLCCRAIRDPEQHLVPLLEVAAADSLDWARLAALVPLIPSEPSPAVVRAVQTLISQISDSLSARRLDGR